jgi:hypothetical protein
LGPNITGYENGFGREERRRSKQTAVELDVKSNLRIYVRAQKITNSIARMQCQSRMFSGDPLSMQYVSHFDFFGAA